MNKLKLNKIIKTFNFYLNFSNTVIVINIVFINNHNVYVILKESDNKLIGIICVKLLKNKEKNII